MKSLLSMKRSVGLLVTNAVVSTVVLILRFQPALASYTHPAQSYSRSLDCTPFSPHTNKYDDGLMFDMPTPNILVTYYNPLNLSGPFALLSSRDSNRYSMNPKYYQSGIEDTLASLILIKSPLYTPQSYVFFDVGMNNGFFTNFAGSLGYHVTSFDPQPFCHYLSTRSAKKNGIIDMVSFMNVGLASPSSTNLFIKVGKSHCHGGRSFGEEVLVSHEINTVRVPLVPLSSFLTDSYLCKGKKVAFMKIDTEGNEWHILQDIFPDIRSGKICNIIVETSTNNLQAKGFTLEQATRIIREIMMLSKSIYHFGRKPYYRGVKRASVEVPNSQTVKYIHLLKIVDVELFLWSEPNIGRQFWFEFDCFS